MTPETHIRISADDRKAINTFAREHRHSALFAFCQVASRSLETVDGFNEHVNLAYFGITEPGTIGATDLADFGPRLADLKTIEAHKSGYVVADFYCYGRDRVGGDLQLDTNVQAVWFNGTLVALSEGSSDTQWLVDRAWFLAWSGQREAVLVGRHVHAGVTYTIQRWATDYRVTIAWPDGTESTIGDWPRAMQARREACLWIEDNVADHAPLADGGYQYTDANAALYNVVTNETVRAAGLAEQVAAIVADGPGSKYADQADTYHAERSFRAIAEQVTAAPQRLVSGQNGATTYAELRPGVVVADEFGKLYGIVRGPFVSSVRSDWAGDAASLATIVDTFGQGEMVIGGRFLAPVVHGPARLDGYSEALVCLEVVEADQDGEPVSHCHRPIGHDGEHADWAPGECTIPDCACSDPQGGYFDRFDVCNAWHVWACEWGEYAVITRLDKLGYKPSPMLRGRQDLEDNALAIWQALEARSQADESWYTRQRAERASRASCGHFDVRRPLAHDNTYRCNDCGQAL